MCSNAPIPGTGAHTDAAGGCGLVALGDSITYGEGGIVLGVDGRSCALWMAQALDTPYTNYAVSGARVGGVVADQLPRVRRAYDVGALYAGVNDARSPEFDAGTFARDIDRAVAGLAAHCAKLLVLTIPRDLGRPRASEKVCAANTAIRAAAAAADATVVGLEDFAGWRHVLPDAVHPTALGQLEIADRAARALGASILPSARTPPRTGRAARARVAADWGRMWARSTTRRTVARWDA